MRFKMIVMSIDNNKEVSIIDTEEENAQLFCCNCQPKDLFFCKQEVQQVLDQLNFQNDWIDDLIKKNKILTEKINKQNRK